MTPDLFKLLLDRVHTELKRMTDTKGVEYAASADQLDNFKRQAAALDVSPEFILMVYLSKHIDSIRLYCKNKSRAVSEPIESRITDAILYLCLLLALVEDETNPFSY